MDRKLPLEVIFVILMEANIKTVINMSITEKIIFNICNSKYFWINKIKYDTLKIVCDKQCSTMNEWIYEYIIAKEYYLAIMKYVIKESQKYNEVKYIDIDLPINDFIKLQKILPTKFSQLKIQNTNIVSISFMVAKGKWMITINLFGGNDNLLYGYSYLISEQSIKDILKNIVNDYRHIDLTYGIISYYDIKDIKKALL